jgi:hypothetical protein
VNRQYLSEGRLNRFEYTGDVPWLRPREKTELNVCSQDNIFSVLRRNCFPVERFFYYHRGIPRQCVKYKILWFKYYNYNIHIHVYISTTILRWLACLNYLKTRKNKDQLGKGNVHRTQPPTNQNRAPRRHQTRTWKSWRKCLETETILFHFCNLWASSHRPI